MSQVFCGFEYLLDELLKKEPQLRKSWGKYISQRNLNIQKDTRETKEREQKLEQKGV